MSIVNEWEVEVTIGRPQLEGSWVKTRIKVAAQNAVEAQLVASQIALAREDRTIQVIETALLEVPWF